MKHLNLQLSEELLDELKTICKKEKVTMNSFIRTVVKHYIDTYIENNKQSNE